MLGRAPDYLNRAVTGSAAAAPYCGENDPRFADNVRRYYEVCRERDVCLTHTLINPQANRATGPAGQADPYLAAAIVRETDAGVVIRGARMLATLPVADEILVFPSTLLRGKDEDRPYAFAFAIPCGVPGLKFICRETFDPGGSAFDHPLASRFEEMDAVVIFEDVVVPWERIFLLRDVERCNKAFAATGAVAHMAHQVVTKNIAKTEFVLGIASLMVEAIAVEQFQHVQSKIAEIIYYLESMRAFARASEADATVNPWGVMTPAWPPLDAARNMFTWMYPRMIEILQLLGASGMMARPTEADLESPLRPLIEKYFQAAQLGAVDRIKLFRLAWDAALSSFGSRQVIYERFFFGDPVRMQMATFASYDRQPYMERVRHVLAEDQEPLSRYFSGAWPHQAPPEFRFVPWPGGPRLVSALAAVGCVVDRRVEAGDHSIVLGRVVALHEDGQHPRPLLFYGGRYRRLTEAEPPTVPPEQWPDDTVQIYHAEWSAGEPRPPQPDGGLP